jgi:Ca-activated chloride channel family protein
VLCADTQKRSLVDRCFPDLQMMTLRNVTLTALTLATVAVLHRPLLVHAQEALPVFKSSVALVPITALVRDSRNRIVRNLNRNDFQVFEGGRPRTIVDFGAKENAPVTVAFLFDTSGSMGVSANLEKGKDVVEDFVAGMDADADHVALFTFGKALREEVPFTTDRDEIYDALDGVKPWGLTSLYDAIAQTAKQLADQPSQHRAVVVITDGLDTSSALTPSEVSGLASSIDVPVYVVAVVSPLDHPRTPAAVVADTADAGLANLARWTGGELFHVSAFDQTLAMTRDLMATMRHQYFLAIESSSAPGWYQLEVKTKRQGLTVRARSGYFAADPPSITAAESIERPAQN